jgi:hypothetical protein
MLEIVKHEEKYEIINDSDHHPDFIEQEKQVPILKKKPLPSLKWLDNLVDFISDLFT